MSDDWAEDHHGIEVMDEAGVTQLHELIGRHEPEDAEDAEVVIGIETGRGPWAAALAAAGYVVLPVNPLQASRYREWHGVSGAKSDQGDSHMLADMVRTDSHQLRPAARDSPHAGAVKVVARTHKTLIWDRTRQVRRPRHQSREYFPAALEAFGDLDARYTLELLGKAPDPARARRLTRAQVAAALKRARRRDIADKAGAILAAAYAATVRSLIAVITTLNEQVKTGMGAILSAPVLGEFGADLHRYADGKARKNYAATSPTTRTSGKKKVVAARGNLPQSGVAA